MAWVKSESLPEIKYKKKHGQIHITDLVNDIVLKLPSRQFKDNVHFESIVEKIFEQVWPEWEEYFSPYTRKSFLKLVIRHVEMDLHDDNRSDKNSSGTGDGRPDLAKRSDPSG